jgi:hypothetical protein
MSKEKLDMFLEVVEKDRMITPHKRKVFVLSEETVATLKLWELDHLCESDAMVKLQRMLHTAPASEKNKIRRALAELRKKEQSQEKDLVRYLGKSIYLNWGEKSFGYYVTPDTWYRDVDSTTFFYFLDDNSVVYDSGKQSHYKMLYSNDDLMNKMVDAVGDFDIESDDFQKIIYDNTDVIGGRAGPWDEDDEEEGESFAISIWTVGVNKDTLVDLMDALDKELGREHETLFTPDKKLH